MSTTRDMRRLFKPLLQANSDLIVVGRDLVLTPIRHVASGLLTEHFLYPENFRAYLHVQKLFVPKEHVTFVSDQKVPSAEGGCWSLANEKDRDQFFDLMHNTVLPEQRKRLCIKAACEYWLSIYSGDGMAPNLRIRGGHETMMAIALGDLDEAAKRFRAYKDEFGLFNYQQEVNAEVPGLGDRLAEQGNDLSAEDRAALADVLHTFEEFTVTNLKLNKYWERTPFPLEESIQL